MVLHFIASRTTLQTAEKCSDSEVLCRRQTGGGGASRYSCFFIYYTSAILDCRCRSPREEQPTFLRPLHDTSLRTSIGNWGRNFLVFEYQIALSVCGPFVALVWRRVGSGFNNLSVGGFNNLPAGGSSLCLIVGVGRG